MARRSTCASVTLLAEDVAFEDGHRAGVLHGARVEFGHKQLVVLLERVGAAELRLEEFEALPGQLEDVVGVQVLHQRLPGEHAQRDHAAVRAGDLAADRLVRAGDQRGDVGGEPGRGRELPRPSGRRRRPPGVVSAGAGVGELEMTSQCDGAVTVNVKVRLEVRLLEDGEHPARIRHLELGVQVDLVVHRIHEAVQALAGVHVRRVGHHREFVVRRQVRQLDPDAVGHRRPDPGHAPLSVTLWTVWVTASMKVEDPGTAAELHRGGAAEDLLAPGQVQADVVGIDGDQFGALAGFGARQVHTWQSVASRRVAVAGGRWPAPAL